jgi:hypothetical protein
VRASVDAFFFSDTDHASGDCFIFDAAANPDIVSFSSSSSCDSHSCSYNSGEFKITFTSAYTADTQITIDLFNFLDYLYTGGDVAFGVNFYTGCSGTATAFTVDITFSEAIAIASSAISIDSSSVIVGATGGTLNVAVTDVTFPAEGKILLTLPKRIGTTTMISANSCNSFAFNGLTTASCDTIDIGSSSDEIEIIFTSSEGELTVDFDITDFDNPYSTTAHSGFGYEVQELGADANYYVVSTGSSFSMTALTTPYTIDATLAVASGVIEESDTLEIYFDISNAKVDEECDFKIVLPTDFGFVNGGSVSGKGCFAKSSSTTNVYSTITSTYVFTYPDDNSYEGGEITGTGLCPT